MVRGFYAREVGGLVTRDQVILSRSLILKVSAGFAVKVALTCRTTFC